MANQPQVTWTHIVVHHTATPATTTVASIREYHLKNGFSDIGYHVLINWRGEVIPGRPLTKMGAHAKGRAPGTSPNAPSLNHYAIGVSCINDFDKGPIPPVQYGALVKMVRDLMIWFEIPAVNILLHRQVITYPTSCPGKLFPETQFRADIAGR